MAATGKGLRLGEKSEQFVFLSINRKEGREGGRKKSLSLQLKDMNSDTHLSLVFVF